MGKAIGALRKIAISPESDFMGRSQAVPFEGKCGRCYSRRLICGVVNCPAGLKVEGFGFSRLWY